MPLYNCPALRELYLCDAETPAEALKGTQHAPLAALTKLVLVSWCVVDPRARAPAALASLCKVKECLALQRLCRCSRACFAPARTDYAAARCPAIHGCLLAGNSPIPWTPPPLLRAAETSAQPNAPPPCALPPVSWRHEPHFSVAFTSVDARAVAAACPELVHLHLERFVLQGSWEGVVRPQLTSLEVITCRVELQLMAAVEEEDHLAAWAGAPLLHAAAPHLAALDTLDSGPLVAAALLDRRLTALTSLALDADHFGLHGDGSGDGPRETGYAMHKVERLAPPMLYIRLLNPRALGDGDFGAAAARHSQSLLSWLFGRAVGWSARGALQTLTIQLPSVPVPVHLLLPALAPLGGSLVCLHLYGCVIGPQPSCARALRCLPVFTALEMLHIQLSSSDMTGITDGSLRALVAPLTSLASHAPELRRVFVQLPLWFEGMCAAWLMYALRGELLLGLLPPELLSIELGTQW